MAVGWRPAVAAYFLSKFISHCFIMETHAYFYVIVWRNIHRIIVIAFRIIIIVIITVSGLDHTFFSTSLYS